MIISLLYLIMSCFLFFVDLLVNLFFNVQALVSLKLFFYSQVFSQKRVSINLFIILFFILLQSFIYTSSFFINLAFIIPALILSQIIKALLHYSSILYALLAVMFVVLNYFFIDYLIFSRPLELLINLKKLGIYFIIVLLIDSFFKVTKY